MAPTDGMVSYSSPVENGSYIFGTVATFSCSLGFGLSSLEPRTCTGENDGAKMGTFGSSPTCVGELFYNALMNAHVLVLLIPCFFSQQSPALFLLN